ncbi:hypothetical protein D3C83_330000 [compost metagenome]
MVVDQILIQVGSRNQLLHRNSHRVKPVARNDVPGKLSAIDAAVNVHAGRRIVDYVLLHRGSAEIVA